MKSRLKHILVMLFVLNSYITTAQSMQIDSIYVNRVIEDVQEIISTETYNGPFVWLVLRVHNDTDSLMALHIEHAELYIEFKYKKRDYKVETNKFFSFKDDKDILIAPGEDYVFGMGDYLLLYTPLWKPAKDDKVDYSVEMVQVLPTLQVTYRDNVNSMKTPLFVKGVNADGYKYIFQL